MLISGIIEELVAELTHAPVSRVGIPDRVESGLVEKGVSPLAAAELSEKYTPIFLAQLELALQNWDAEQVPRPIVTSRSGRIAFGLASHKYDAGLPAHYFDVLHLIEGADEHQIIGIAVLANAAIGCDRIFVTDRGGGDAGVDVLSRLIQPLGCPSLLIATQCKAYKSPLANLEVEQIQHRYAVGLAEEDKWEQYLTALSAGSLRVPLSKVLSIVASNGLSYSGRTRAQIRGVAFSSPRQLGLLLASQLTATEIRDFCQTVPTSRDLSRDLSKEVPSVLQPVRRQPNGALF